MTKEIDMTKVFIEPIKIRNCSRFCLPVISEPIIAAWDEPNPGKKEQIGETRIVARVGLIKSFLSRFSFSKSCFGIIVFDFMEWIIVEVPKSPVRSGSRDCWMSKFSVESPRSPARVKIKIAFILDSFSL